MNKKMTFIFLAITFVVLMSSSIVCAADNTTSDATATDATQPVIDDSNTAASQDTTATISDLKKDLDNSNGSFSLRRNYSYDNSTDSAFENNGINIKDTKLNVEGNNYTINMNGHASLFNIIQSDVKISNLNIRNTKNTAINLTDSNLTTTRVNFENNDAFNSSAVYINKSKYDSSFDTFTNLKNDKGSAISAFNNSILYLTYATFNNVNKQKWGAVYISDSSGLIANTTFANMQSKYSTAIYISNGTFNITNCSFINLTADETAGAIAYKNINNLNFIDNCKFINLSSIHNGGALFVDINGYDEVKSGKLTVKDSLFNNCESNFGGAILQLGGLLSVNNTTFSNNYADILGGAVYTSFVALSIENSTFKNNNVPIENESYNQGGALYFDSETLKINNSRFEANNAFRGIDAYLYDARYQITNSYFTGEIYSMFDDNGIILSNNTFLGNNSFNNTEYIYVYESNGSSIEYNPVILDESLVNATSFDLRDYGLVSPVKNQGNSGSCWTFGTTGALESAFLKASNRTAMLDISEANIRDSGLMYSTYGLNEMFEGSQASVGSSYMLSWLGVTTSNDNSYDELGKISPIIDNGTKYHIQNIVMLKPLKDVNDNQRLKDALVKYGAICVSVYATRTPDSTFNEKTHAAYFYNQSISGETNHAITVVGWNDSYSRYNFKTTPPGDGAWIIKNSWGTDWGDNGYYYVSYYDVSFARSKYLIGYIIDNNNSYEKNYQYDFITPFSIMQYPDGTNYLNKFVSVGEDLISAVGTYFNDAGIKYKFDIYVNDKLVHSQEGISKYSGYETIKLNKFVGLKENDTFIIEMSADSYVPISRQSRQHYQSNTSFMKTSTLSDLSDNGKVVCLKAYTIPDNSDMNVTGDGNNTHIQYFDQDAKILSNTNVTVKYNDSNYTFTTDDEGFIILNLSFPQGRSDVTLINPINGREYNLLIYVPKDDDSIIYYPSSNNIDENDDTEIIDSVKYVETHKSLNHVNKAYKNVQPLHKTYKVLVNDYQIFEGRYFTIESLNDIFNNSFINGHLVVYIDGVVVFNATVGDDVSLVLFEIIDSLIGHHELKVEYTADNETHTYTENISIN